MCQQITFLSLAEYNTDAGCTAITSFLEYNGISKRGMQFEMIKDLTV